MPSQFPKLKLDKNPGEIARSRFLPATKHDLKKVYKLIMSAISDFLAKQTAWNARQSGAVDSVVASLEGLTGDVQTLNDKITELQNSLGTFTPEDQATVDALQAQGEALAGKLETISAALAALDALTPPKPPVTPA